MEKIEKGCPICHGNQKFLFSTSILNKYEGKIYQCVDCLFTNFIEPIWLEESYGKAIADSDLGLLERNIEIRSKLASLLHFFIERKKEDSGKLKYLDYGGGYGILVRLMRDLGFDTYWADQYCKNIFSPQFIGKENQAFDGVFLFEVLEHLKNPKEELQQICRQYSPNHIIFTQENFLGISPNRNWWYLATNTGQHISFFHQNTLKKLGEELGMNYYGVKNFHLFTKEKMNPFRLKLFLGPISQLLILYIRKVRKSFLQKDVGSYFRLR